MWKAVRQSGKSWVLQRVLYRPLGTTLIKTFVHQWLRDTWSWPGVEETKMNQVCVLSSKHSTGWENGEKAKCNSALPLWEDGADVLFPIPPANYNEKILDVYIETLKVWGKKVHHLRALGTQEETQWWVPWVFLLSFIFRVGAEEAGNPGILTGAERQKASPKACSLARGPGKGPWARQKTFRIWLLCPKQTPQKRL